MTRSATVTLILLCWVAILLAIAAWAARRTHNAADVVIASRRLGPWLVALSYAGNTLNAWMLMLLSGFAFVWGLSAAWLWAAMVCGCIVNLWFVGPRLRSLAVGQGSVTLTQVLSADVGDRLQPLVVRSATFILLVTLLPQAGAMLRAAGDVLANDFGFDLGSSVGTATILVTLCVFAGGFRAASVCDAAQTIVVFLVAAFLPLPALIATDGWDQLREGMNALGPATMDWFGGRSGVVAIAFAAGVSGIGLATSGQPHAVSRFIAARDDAALRLARWIATAWVAVLVGAVLFCGWCASVLYAGLGQPEHAMIALASRLLPPWLGALIVLGLLFAIVLSLASQLLVVATGLAVDLRRAPAPVSPGWTRSALLVAAAATLCIGLYSSESLLAHATYAYTALGAAFGPLLLVRLSGKRIRPGSTLGAMWAGYVLSLVFHLLPDSPGDFLERVLPFIAALGIALTGGEPRRNPDRADRSQETVHDRVPI
jgi:sodium/proline symporter